MKLTIEQISKVLTVHRHSQDKKYVYADCPVCGKDEFYLLFLEDNQPCGCSRGKKCGWKGNIFTLLKLLGKSTEFVQDRDVNVFKKLESNLGEKILDLNLELPQINPPMLWKRVHEDEYLRSRGFEDADFEKYEVGRSAIKKDYVTFLVRQKGLLVGYIGRSERSKVWIDQYNARQKEKGSEHIYPRYDNSVSDFAKMLFGYDELVTNVTTDVILVEGIFSKAKTDNNLQLNSSDEIKCCATFGAKISPEQIELLRLKGVKNVWLWFEADVLKSVKQSAAKLFSYFNVKVSYLKDKDPNDIGPEEAMQLLEEAKGYSDFNVSYVSNKLKE